MMGAHYSHITSYFLFTHFVRPLPPDYMSSNANQQQMDTYEAALYQQNTGNMYPPAPGPPSQQRQVSCNTNTHFTTSDIREELTKRQLAALAPPTTEAPPEVEGYCELSPLEPAAEQMGFFGMRSTCYKATSMRDYNLYCLRRVQSCTITNRIAAESWKKLTNSNVVQLRDAIQTTAFNDSSVIFVHEYYPGAVTVKQRFFGRPEWMEGLRESDVWPFLIQLTSALNAIHSAKLAARTVDPTKVLIQGKNKLMISGGGVFDTLFYEQNEAAIREEQNKDFFNVGRLLLALCNGNLGAASVNRMRESLANVSHLYSADLHNALMQLLSGQARIANLMPLIGARFFTHADSLQSRIDKLENEFVPTHRVWGKWEVSSCTRHVSELDNARLFRLVAKLNTLVRRRDMGNDWNDGDGFLLQCFHEYVFHAVSADGRPFLDMTHILNSLNKLDSGSPEIVQLMNPSAPDNIIVISYADLKRKFERQWDRLRTNPAEVVQASLHTGARNDTGTRMLAQALQLHQMHLNQ